MVDVILNSSDEPVVMDMARTAEIMPYGTKLHDLVGGGEVTIEKEMTFAPLQTLILTNF